MRDSSFILRELEQKLQGCLDRPAELGGLLKSFINGPDATALLNDLLATYVSAWDVNALRRFDSESLLLLQNEQFTLALKLVKDRSELLKTSGTDRYTVFRSSSPVTVDKYHIVGRFDNPDVFDPEATLELVSSSPDDGAHVCQTKFEPYIYDWHSPTPLLLAQLVVYPSSSQVWFFRRETLRAAFPVVGRMEFSSFVLLSRMVASLNEKRALPMLQDLSENPSHVVRWAAIQAIGKLDGAAGRDALRRALVDNHPHISSAAAKALAKLSG